MASAPEDARSSGLWAIWRVNPTFLAQPISPTQEAVRSGGCFAPTATTTSGKSCCRWTCRNCPWARRWVGWVGAEAERVQSDSARSNCMDAPGGGARQIIPSQRHPGLSFGRSDAYCPSADLSFGRSGYCSSAEQPNHIDCLFPTTRRDGETHGLIVCGGVVVVCGSGLYITRGLTV